MTSSSQKLIDYDVTLYQKNNLPISRRRVSPVRVEKLLSQFFFTLLQTDASENVNMSEFLPGTLL